MTFDEQLEGITRRRVERRACAMYAGLVIDGVNESQAQHATATVWGRSAAFNAWVLCSCPTLRYAIELRRGGA